MHKILLFGLVCVALVVAQVQAQSELQGTRVESPNSNSSQHAKDLFQGDLGAEIGLGCSNASGTSGGPNEVAVRVTSPFQTLTISAHYYHVFTNVSPTITALTFSVWDGGSTPGAILRQQRGLDFAEGVHTVSLAPPIFLGSDVGQFFFGQTQPQSTAAIRWGVDTSSGGGSESFISAPGCGLSAWSTLSSLGFAGNWVMSISVYDGVSPIELRTWGQVKTIWE